MSVCNLGNWLFFPLDIFEVLSRLLHLSIIFSYLQLSSILWYRCTIICLTIHSRTSGLVPALVYYDSICIYIFVCIHFPVSSLNKWVQLLCSIAVVWFCFLTNFQNVFQESCNTLYPHNSIWVIQFFHVTSI